MVKTAAAVVLAVGTVFVTLRYRYLITEMKSVPDCFSGNEPNMSMASYFNGPEDGNKQNFRYLLLGWKSQAHKQKSLTVTKMSFAVCCH